MSFCVRVAGESNCLCEAGRGDQTCYSAKMKYRGKKIKIRGKIEGFNKPKIQGNTMKLSSNTGGKIHVYVVY